MTFYERSELFQKYPKTPVFDHSNYRLFERIPAVPGTSNNRGLTVYIFFLEIIPCHPSIYTMEQPDLTVSNLMENSIGLKRVLSYDVASGSEITPCTKIDKAPVVYILTGKVMKLPF